MSRRSRRRSASVFALLALGAAFLPSCGGDDDTRASCDEIQAEMTAFVGGVMDDLAELGVTFDDGEAVLTDPGTLDVEKIQEQLRQFQADLEVQGALLENRASEAGCDLEAMRQAISAETGISLLAPPEDEDPTEPGGSGGSDGAGAGSGTPGDEGSGPAEGEA